MQIKIDQIKIENRIRNDYGDIETLAESINGIGLLQPICITSGYQLIAGERRIKAHQMLGLEYIEGRIIHLDNIVSGEYAENEIRKDFTVSERVAILELIDKYTHGGDRKNQEQNFAVDRNTAAKQAGLGNKETARQASQVISEGAPELIDKMDSGDVSISTASDISTLPKEQQQEIVVKGEKEILEAAKQIRAKKAEKKRIERIEKISQISKGNMELKTDKTYPVIYADPPWRYEHSETDSRKIENQYPTMVLEDICNLSIPATEDAILFLWATAPKLEESMMVINAWGFKYRSCAIWDKEKMGMGYYFRIQHELLLIATKGNIPTPIPENRPRSIFSFSREDHSSKPAEVAEYIEVMYPELNKLELFCRQPRKGWDVWGNQSAA